MVITKLLIRKKEEICKLMKSKFCFWVPSLTFKTGCSNLSAVPLKYGNKSTRLILNSEKYGNCQAKGTRRALEETAKGKEGHLWYSRAFSQISTIPELRGLSALRSFCKLNKIIRKPFIISAKC